MFGSLITLASGVSPTAQARQDHRVGAVIAQTFWEGGNDAPGERDVFRPDMLRRQRLQRRG